MGPSGVISLQGLRAIWWFGFQGTMVEVLITIIWVRITKELR